MSHQSIIQAVSEADIGEVLNFVLAARAELFPKLSATCLLYTSDAADE